MADFASIDPSTAYLLLARDDKPDHAADILKKTIVTIKERHDCSDFNILVFLWIWKEFAHKLAPDLSERLATSILGYRFWMDEPGNDVMWFWPENHVLCFHAAQYLAA